MENYRTDLAVEIMNKNRRRKRGAEVESADGRGGTKINRVRITSEAAARDIGKPIGNYHTVDYVELDSETYEYREEISRILPPRSIWWPAESERKNMKQFLWQGSETET